MESIPAVESFGAPLRLCVSLSLTRSVLTAGRVDPESYGNAANAEHFVGVMRMSWHRAMLSLNSSIVMLRAIFIRMESAHL